MAEKHMRKPIVAIVGHVDHGKTSVLDFIRRSTVAEREAGKITQAIGASIVPIETIQRICGDLLTSLNMDFSKFPGLLFIDTPGHAAFTNLRKRGGNLADVAILVVDINEGFKPQTLEAVEILKTYKTPFIVAANKIDLISGWHQKDVPLLAEIESQTDTTKQMLDRKLYELLGKFAELGFESERFDRIKDYTKQIAMVPLSAKTGEGIPELLMVLTGMAQKFLEKCLECNIEVPGRGSILEVKEEKGLGKTFDMIIHEGNIRTNDTIVIGGMNGPIVTKVKALLEPVPLAEMRDSKSDFKPVKQVEAATGIKISAPNIEEVVAGMPVVVVRDDDIEKIKEKIQEEVEEVLIETDKDGLIIKADSLGSLEALICLLREKNVPIRKASIGNISKKEINEAESNIDKDPLAGIILGFNVKMEPDLELGEVTILTNPVIYRLIEDYENWVVEQKKKIEAKELDKVVRPFKIQLIKGYIFRQSGPAIVGVSVLNGTIRTGTDVMKDGKTISHVKGIQSEKKNVKEAEMGKEVAVSLDNVTVGRQIKEEDVLYSYITEEDFRIMKKFKEYLSADEKECLRQIAEIMRKDNPVWGV
ncbi:translation initiation factor IF-2 [Nanoarchaeota archaeon]